MPYATGFISVSLKIAADSIAPSISLLNIAVWIADIDAVPGILLANKIHTTAIAVIKAHTPNPVKIAVIKMVNRLRLVYIRTLALS